MNIFYLDSDPVMAAKYHCNKHCVKMILETAQLLSTAHRILDGELYIESSTGRNIKRWRLENNFLNETFYKATHINHPSSIWARQSWRNYIWLSHLLEELCKEYTHRYGKIHKIQNIGLMHFLKLIPKNIQNNGFSEPPQAMPDDCKVSGDSVTAYRNYYIRHKRNMLEWKNRDVPRWLFNMADVPPYIFNVITRIDKILGTHNRVEIYDTWKDYEESKSGKEFPLRKIRPEAV